MEMLQSSNVKMLKCWPKFNLMVVLWHGNSLNNIGKRRKKVLGVLMISKITKKDKSLLMFGMLLGKLFVKVLKWNLLNQITSLLNQTV